MNGIVAKYFISNPEALPTILDGNSYCGREPTLLVIMTLLAVLLAIPKPTRANLGGPTHALFVGCHQVALWILSGTLVWMILGKRRIVLVVESFVLVLIWGPLFTAVAEDLLFGSRNHSIVRSVLKPLGLYDAYGEMYHWIFKAFGSRLQTQATAHSRGLALGGPCAQWRGLTG